MLTQIRPIELRSYICILTLILVSINLKAENGHKLWLRNEYTGQVNIDCSVESSIIDIAKAELLNNWNGVDGNTISLTIANDTLIKGDGFILSTNQIKSNTDKGILYGVYELLRQQQTRQSVEEKVYNPSYDLRLLNHWDNLSGSVERGYAGPSIFWRNDLPVSEDDRKLWAAYARANASIGINATVLNNVNASPNILKKETLERVKAIANNLRPYGVQVFISINFASPSAVGGLDTSDPLDSLVIEWWQSKAEEIYSIIPDFGGFLVKANSEGQPGPHDYGRTHVDGANMLAKAVAPHGGIVMWRAFVYGSTAADRVREAYDEFYPLDGQFDDNVIIQVKNGPIDFQPREPFSPLFGAMKNTVIMPELQITQEYLGHSTHLVYLAPMWQEFFQSNTYQEGTESTVAKCTDGSIFNHPTAIAGVANTGKNINWCGHDFAQANWYAFGRLAWNNQLSSEQIADEWIKLTFNPVVDKKANLTEDWQLNFLAPVKQIMLDSYETCVDYMMPLGLTHIFAKGHHYGPGPWSWRNYHKVDANGLGFDRSASGSNAVAQYHEPLSSEFGNINTCPDKFLMWFHHVPWEHEMPSGKTLWDELCHRYDTGVKQVIQFLEEWDKVEKYVDTERYELIQRKLRFQNNGAQIWKDACILYFQEYSKQPIPTDIEPPIFALEDLKNHNMLRLIEGNMLFDTIARTQFFIEAESYISQSGTKELDCIDQGGGKYVGYINNNDWCSYKINTNSAGVYDFYARAATPGVSGTIEISANNKVVGTVNVDETQSDGWQDWYTTEPIKIVLEKGIVDLKTTFKGSANYLYNLNWYKIEYNLPPIDTSLQDTSLQNTSLQSHTESELYFRVYPNPFSDYLYIDYELRSKSNVNIEILDINGKAVKSLVHENNKLPGNYQITWNKAGKQNGIYFMRIIINDRAVTKKLILNGEYK